MLNGQLWQTAPYMARVMYGQMGQLQLIQAGGIIISHRHVLTSGFVLTNDMSILQVWIGGVTRGSQVQALVNNNPSRFLHPGYQASPRLNDIGIILLATDLTFSRSVQPVDLPPLQPQGTPLLMIPLLHEQGTTLGLGGLIQQGLQAAFLRVVTPARCNTLYPIHNAQNQFCAEDTRMRSDFCSTDIGGPFLTLERGVEVLTGINSQQVCNLNVASQPSLFTRVSAYRQWISDTIQV